MQGTTIKIKNEVFIQPNTTKVYFNSECYIYIFDIITFGINRTLCWVRLNKCSLNVIFCRYMSVYFDSSFLIVAIESCRDLDDKFFNFVSFVEAVGLIVSLIT